LVIHFRRPTLFLV